MTEMKSRGGRPIRKIDRSGAPWLLAEIEELRFAKQITLDNLCDQAGVPRSTYSAHCRGRYRISWFDYLDDLLEILGKRLTIVDAD